MDISDLLVQGPCRRRSIGSDPSVPHRSLSIIIDVFQLAEIKIDPLDGRFLPSATLEAVEGNRNGLGLSTPVALRADGAKRAGELLDHPPGAGVWDGQLAVSGGLGRKQPDSLPGLDGIFLVPVSMGASLEGSCQLGLDGPVSPKLVFL